MRRPWTIALLFLLFAGAGPARAGEKLHYHWSLDGFIGLIASLFMPTDGDGLLSFEEIAPGVSRGVLQVTSPESRSGEFFRYGAEWQLSDGRTLRAWSDQLWRGEKKSKKSELGDAGVIDIVSGIDLLRRRPPVSQQRLEIWSDGKRYPVIVLPRGPANKHVAGRDVATRHLSVRGVAVPDRNMWKGELDLWLADDEVATPVEILVSRSGARVRLTLVEYPASSRSLTATEPEGSQ